MSMDSFDFVVGTQVVSSDGQQLGSVKEIVGPYFKVDAPMAPDYWLPRSAVRSADQDQLVLGFTEEQVGGYEVDPQEVESTRAAEAQGIDRATFIAWGADQWMVVRGRIQQRWPQYNESELDDMRDRNPEGFRERFAEAIREANESSEELARTVDENT